jgi:hypothetical protein
MTMYYNYITLWPCTSHHTIPLSDVHDQQHHTCVTNTLCVTPHNALITHCDCNTLWTSHRPILCLLSSTTLWPYTIFHSVFLCTLFCLHCNQIHNEHHIVLCCTYHHTLIDFVKHYTLYTFLHSFPFDCVIPLYHTLCSLYKNPNGIGANTTLTCTWENLFYNHIKLLTLVCWLSS